MAKELTIFVNFRSRIDYSWDYAISQCGENDPFNKYMSFVDRDLAAFCTKMNIDKNQFTFFNLKSDYDTTVKYGPAYWSDGPNVRSRVIFCVNREQIGSMSEEPELLSLLLTVYVKL